MVTTMADFPPNPEDGELWLPSEILHEITSANITPPHNTLLAPHHYQPRANVPRVALAPNFEICFGSFHVKINASGSVGDPSASSSLCCGPELAVPAPISLYNPITPAQSLQLGFAEKGSMVYAEKYGGTGVFLPRSVNTAAASRKAEQIGAGAGVFLNHDTKPAITTQKKRKSGKSEGSLGGSNEKMKCSLKKEALEKEQSQHPSEICLPHAWTY